MPTRPATKAVRSVCASTASRTAASAREAAARASDRAGPGGGGGTYFHPYYIPGQTYFYPNGRGYYKGSPTARPPTTSSSGTSTSYAPRSAPTTATPRGGFGATGHATSGSGS